MATIVKAPAKYTKDKFAIFLAGAIDMGEAEDWQTKISEALSEFDILILNPRRDDWDSSWKQTKDDPQFSEQVNWEQDALEIADLILVVFTKDSKAPITFLELGMHMKDDVLVCCPEGFYRKGNVDICCERNGVTVWDNLDDFINDLKLLLWQEGLYDAD
jgi:hypothetical protein